MNSEKIAKFSEILFKFNKIHNLTNYKDLKPVVDDSLLGLKYITNSPKVAIDVGSGAGFPAIFLAMYLSECEWHLFEPNLKKSSFLTYAKINLNLENVIIHSQKIEEAPKFRADLITSRALMKTRLLLEICNGFYDEKTLFVLYKGSDANEEIKEIVAKRKEIVKEKNRNFIVIEGAK
ncbi:MAG: 16S rRNA (guanine(527)-N(7))-methyltransferase RsmG [Campylobacteraceae bacterium]|nr:16S rRNA (guanine(527)-N(7))-methyltransferase RsmG [Campylobacteraceae bacterium]